MSDRRDSRGRRGRGGGAGTPSGPVLLPAVEVELPGGTGVVRGRLIRWRQTDQGRWVARVGVEVWGSTARTGRDDVEVQVLEMDAPSGRLRRVRGAVYDGVPVLRSVRHPERTPPPAPVREAESSGGAGGGGEGAVSAGGEAGGGWVVEVVPLGRGLRVHEPGCWAIHGRTGGVLDAEEAVKLLRLDPEAEACDVCAGGLADGGGEAPAGGADSSG
ncbi:DUF6233 domain-containing protein [Streptomyces sp. NBC_00237]|uniref:DUF6233 domain-containing protein n=1 Tax=Streptomyces sp. NBC_00237 TaxID=2975687 RepID=UPI0022537A87|nr:DUF6233 domain-containing protein [Streptomyces sp. NBC_00237]MCX5207685.1 DUF6233 domain-containing protein [Streptomyces sp. NBC_00237]